MEAGKKKHLLAPFSWLALLGMSAVPSYLVITGSAGGVRYVLALVVLLALGTFLVAVKACRGMGAGNRDADTANIHGRSEITLEELSRFWLPGKRPEQVPAQSPHSMIDMGAGGAPPPGAVEKEPVDEKKQRFTRPETTAFYADVVIPPANGFSADPEMLRCAEEVLLILDRSGGCPSVVDAAVGVAGDREHNGDYKRLKTPSGRSQYDIYREVTLLAHSLRVARLIARKGAYVAETPVLVIAALAHDLGKIPSFRREPVYAVGNHPKIGVLILKLAVKSYARLPDSVRENIERAVSRHHMGNEQEPSPYVRLLQEADWEARAAELREGMPAAKAPAAENGGGRPAAHPPAEASAERPSTSVPAYDPIEIEWFDTARFLERLLPRVNTVTDGRFVAVSMNSGTKSGAVYAQTGLVKQLADDMALEANEEINRQIEGCADPAVREELERRRGRILDYLSGGVSERYQRTMVLSVVDRLRREKKICENLMSRDYIGSRFAVHYQDGHVLEKFYAVPIRMDAFDVMPEELEARKVHGLVRNIARIEIGGRGRKGGVGS
jgi:hypothetical protein